jgi:hypothetical protein
MLDPERVRLAARIVLYDRNRGSFPPTDQTCARNSKVDFKIVHWEKLAKSMKDVLGLIPAGRNC